MISDFLSIILIFFFSLLPLLFWGYGAMYLSHHVWNRARFFAGLFGGGVSIGVITLFRGGLLESGLSQVFAVMGVFLALGVIAWIVTLYGSVYIRGFLRNTLLLHIGLFCLLLLLWGVTRKYIHLDIMTISYIAGITGFFVVACLEEGVKHVSSIGLTARNFRFSRTDFLLFTFFITLGFITVENIAYFIEAYSTGPLQVFMTGIYRLCLALPLHVFAASICVMFWWKALSYNFFSVKYIFFFLLGYILAASVHSLYNFLIIKEAFFFLVLLSLIGYMACTQWVLLSTKQELI